MSNVHQRSKESLGFGHHTGLATNLTTLGLGYDPPDEERNKPKQLEHLILLYNSCCQEFHVGFMQDVRWFNPDHDMHMWLPGWAI